MLPLHCQSADSYLTFIEKPEEWYSENELAGQNGFEAEIRKVLTADGGQYPDALGDAEEERLGITITGLAYWAYPVDRFLREGLHVDIMLDSTGFSLIVEHRGLLQYFLHKRKKPAS